MMLFPEKKYERDQKWRSNQFFSLAPFAFILCLTLFIVYLIYPSSGYGRETVYSVQAGSFRDLNDAQSQFDLLVQKLDDADLDYLRIEAIGNFYAVRLGRFSDRNKADAFLSGRKTLIPGATVMSVYLLEERIIQLYEQETATPPELIKPDIPKEKEPERDISSMPISEQVDIISDLLDKREYEEALRISTSAVSVNQDEHLINGWHGTVLLKMKQPAKAINYFQKASAIAPEISDYQSAIGYCLFFLGKNDNAIEHFNKAIALNSSNVDALAGLGVALHRGGEIDRALEVYERLKDLDANTAEKILTIIEKNSL